MINSLIEVQLLSLEVADVVFCDLFITINYISNIIGRYSRRVQRHTEIIQLTDLQLPTLELADVKSLIICIQKLTI